MEYWSTDVKFNVFGNAALTSEEVITGSIWGRAYGLDRRSGSIKWTFETQGFKDNHLKYFDQQDRFRPDIGSILKTPYAWIAAERRMGGIFSTPAVSNGIVVLTSTEGKVYALKDN